MGCVGPAPRHTQGRRALDAAARAARAARYHVLCAQWMTMDEEQLAQCGSVRAMLHAVEKDVPRTDRDVAFYQDEANLATLERILNTCVL